MTLSSQWGSGLHAGGAEIIYLALESGLEAICSKGVSATALCVDVAAAFAEVAKCLVIRAPYGKAGLLEAAILVGLTPDFAAEVVDEMTGSSIWKNAGASGRLEEYVQEGLRGQVASFEGVSGIFRMQRGTGAGNPCAGLMFSVWCSRVGKRLPKCFRGAGMTAICSTIGARDCFADNRSIDDPDFILEDGSYADDLVAVIEASAGEMTDKLSVAGGIMWQVHTLAGFRVTFGLSKTAVEIRWAGVGVAMAKRKLEQLEDNKIQLKMGERSTFLPVTRSYKHLGSKGSGSMGPEIAFTCIATSTVMKPIENKVFRNPLVSQTSKGHILTASLMSRNTFRMGCWPQLLAAAYRAIKRGLLKLFRFLLPEGKEGSWMSDNALRCGRISKTTVSCSPICLPLEGACGRGSRRLKRTSGGSSGSAKSSPTSIPLQNSRWCPAFRNFA